MSEQDKGENKVTEQPVISSPNDTEDSAVQKTEEEIKLEARKAELEDQVSGLEGTINSLKEDIVRKRQERKGVDEELPQFDKEALMVSLRDELDEKLNARLQPVLEENEKLRKAVLKSNEDALKAKKAQLDSINARIASATAPKTSVNQPQDVEPEVELSDKEAKIAKELGLKNPRYMKDVEVL